MILDEPESRTSSDIYQTSQLVLRRSCYRMVAPFLFPINNISTVRSLTPQLDMLNKHTRNYSVYSIHLLIHMLQHPYLEPS